MCQDGQKQISNRECFLIFFCFAFQDISPPPLFFYHPPHPSHVRFGNNWNWTFQIPVIRSSYSHFINSYILISSERANLWGPRADSHLGPGAVLRAKLRLRRSSERREEPDWGWGRNAVDSRAARAGLSL